MKRTALFFLMLVAMSCLMPLSKARAGCTTSPETEGAYAATNGWVTFTCTAGGDGTFEAKATPYSVKGEPRFVSITFPGTTPTPGVDITVTAGSGTQDILGGVGMNISDFTNGVRGHVFSGTAYGEAPDGKDEVLTVRASGNSVASAVFVVRLRYQLLQR